MLECDTLLANGRVRHQARIRATPFRYVKNFLFGNQDVYEAGIRQVWVTVTQ